MKKRGKSKSHKVRVAVHDLMYRVGTTTKEKMGWLLKQLERSWHGMLPGDRQNFRIELVLFAAHASQAFPGHGGVGFSEDEGLEEIEQPTETQAKKVLAEMDNVVRAALEQRAITTGTYAVSEHLLWDNRDEEIGGQRYVLHKEFKVFPLESDEWKVRILYSLARLLEECGHLLRECSAPIAWKGQGEKCGTIFLARRKDGKFCSAKCRTLATTRASRHATTKAFVTRKGNL